MHHVVQYIAAGIGNVIPELAERYCELEHGSINDRIWAAITEADFMSSIATTIITELERSRM
jgi:hypothetical protein